MDKIVVRRWCDPEPTHGSWGVEDTSSDNSAPQIWSVNWEPSAPFPYVQASQPRQWEPVTVYANVTEEAEGSGLASVELHYSVNSILWWNASMAYNMTSDLWSATIPGQPGNVTVDLIIVASDQIGNIKYSDVFTYEVQSLVVGDLNGDGIVNIFDIVMATGNYMKTSP